MITDRTIGRLSERYGISEDGVQTLACALSRGGGRLAQFSHPELGGYGQWMPGMTQIGDMFNRGLRQRVDGLCNELSAAFESSRSIDSLDPIPPMTPMKPMQSMKPMEPLKPMEPMKGFDDRPANRWWPESLGTSPNSSGGQNDLRYAYFGDKHRLAVDSGNGKVRVYDTGDHAISGVQQHQSGSQDVVFTSQRGEVKLDSLKEV